jgi:hypothetical protein
MGGRCGAIALIASTCWYEWHRHSMALSPGAISLRILTWSLLAAVVGKAAGVIGFRLRSRQAQIRTGQWISPR